MSEWKEYSVTDFAEIQNHRRIPLSTIERQTMQGKFPYYGASGIIDFVDKYIFEGEHLLISEDGENLKSRNTPIAFRAYDKFWVNNHAHILKGKKPYCNRILEYIFQNLDLTPYITGAVQPKLSKGALESIRFELPTSEIEIEGIVGVLSSLDDKIDLLQRQNKTLEEMAETLFRQWFVEEAEDEIAEIPLSEISKHVKRSINPSKSPEQLFKHYSLPSFDNGRSPDIQYGRDILSNKYQISPGQILISKLNPRTPRVWLINSCDNYSICSTEFQVYEPVKKEYTEFIYCLLKSNETRDILGGASSGTSGSHQRVNPEDINKLTIKQPKTEILYKFHQITSAWLEKIDSNSFHIQYLETLRETLLPKLMSGSVTVNDLA